MSEFDVTKDQEVNSVCVTDSDEGNFYRVGFKDTETMLSVTKIEQCEKSGMHSEIPYLRVWADETVIAEMCQHNVAYVTFKPREQP